MSKISSAKPKLLIVDDNEANLHALSRVLESIDIEVITALSGQEALSLVVDNDCFAILMDVQMPEMDGFETASILLANPRTSHIPVIFVTAINKSEEFIIQGYKTGAVDYMTKPLNETILISKVNVFLSLYQQKQMLESQKHELMLSNKSLEEFAHMVSHDLKAPIRHISMFAEIFLKDNSDKLESANIDTENLDIIINSTNRMTQLVNGILQLATISTQRDEFIETNLEEILQEIILSFKVELDSINGDVAFEGKAPMIMGDPVQMRQLFENLIGNSVKYRKQDEALKIVIKVESTDDNPYCKITVSDNGIGFDQSNADEIFKPLNRLVSYSDYEGSGIGLATVKKIIDRHNGTVKVKSEPGEGASFSVSIPKNT